MQLTRELANEVQQAWHRFLQRTEPLRPDLHRSCRSLTGSLWDAEDLVQDTLLPAFAKLAEVADEVDNPKAYLFRIASNLWSDRFRRPEPGSVEVPRPSVSPERAVEVREAARQLLHLLPPQERTAVVLKEVFDFRLEEIAMILPIKVGAIKAALHRGREKLATPAAGRPRDAVSEALLDRFVEAFNARDLDRVAALLSEDAVGEVIAMGMTYGRRAARDSSLYYSLLLEKGDARAERRDLFGEPIAVIWYALDPSQPIVRDVLRFEELEGEISRLRFHAFCPETMLEVTSQLALPFKANGYGVWSPDFLELQDKEGFARWIAAKE